VKKERKRQNIFSKVGGNNTVSTNEHTFWIWEKDNVGNHAVMMVPTQHKAQSCLIIGKWKRNRNIFDFVKEKNNDRKFPCDISMYICIITWIS
jgi:hypothetical protein